MDSIAAILKRKMEVAATILDWLKLVSNNGSLDPEQCLAAYMGAKIMSQIKPAKSDRIPPMAAICNVEHLATTWMLYEPSPTFNFGFLTVDLTILETISDHPKICIIDSDIEDGTHYNHLIRDLAERGQTNQRSRPQLYSTSGLLEMGWMVFLGLF